MAESSAFFSRLVEEEATREVVDEEVPQEQPGQQEEQGQQGPRTLWIGKLAHWMDEHFLFDTFASLGEKVSSTRVIRNKVTRRSEGYGFVKFSNHAAARNILQTFNGVECHFGDGDMGRLVLTLNWAASEGIGGLEDPDPEAEPVSEAEVKVLTSKYHFWETEEQAGCGEAGEGARERESYGIDDDGSLGLVEEEMAKLDLPTCFGPSDATSSFFSRLVEEDEGEEAEAGSAEAGGRPQQRGLWIGGYDPEYELPYYFSEETQESQWEFPPGFVVPMDESTKAHILADLQRPGTLVAADRLLPVTPSKKNKLVHYWGKRFLLFSKFDEGVAMDTTAWYSVTPEKLARHQAKKAVTLCCGDNGDGGAGKGPGVSLVALDAFGGVGGNAIQLAGLPQVSHIYCCELVASRAQKARANADLYGVGAKISFLCSDYFSFLGRNERLSGGRGGIDILFLSPPWGGPGSGRKAKKGKQNFKFDIRHFPGLPMNTVGMLDQALSVARVVALYLPRHTDMKELQKIMRAANVHRYEIENNYHHDHFMARTVYICKEDVKAPL